MLLLTSTSDLIQVVTSGTQAIKAHASYVDVSGTTITPGRLNTAIASAATTTVVGSPAASTQRNVKLLSIYNSDASASDTITVQHTDGTTAIVLFKLSLPAGYTLTFVDGEGWQLFNASGQFVQTANVSGTLLKLTVLTTTTSATFTTGASTNSIKIRGVGGGGGGAGCTSVASAAACGGGGGAGGYLEKLVAVSPNTGYTYQCGAAGAGASGAAGGNGSNSTFTVGATTYTANGGGGAPVATATTTVNTPYLGGAGGAASTNGDLNGAGQPGDPGVFSSVTGPVGFSGNGADSAFGGGGIGLKNAGANGNNATGFGAGGGGASTAASAARTGGNGSQGMWIVEEYS